MNAWCITHATINLIILSVATVTEIIYGVINFRDLAQAVDGFCPASSKFVAAAKILFLLMRRRRVQKCLDTLLNLYLSESDEKNIAINVRVSQYSRYITSCLVVFTNATASTYFAIPIVKFLWAYSTATEYIKQLPYTSALPYDPYKSPMYEMTYIFLGYSGYLTCFSIVGLDGLFIGLCLYISGQFEIIQSDINNLVDREIASSANSTEEFTKEQNDLIYRHLRSCVRRQIDTIKLCEDMVDIFKPNVLLHFISAAIVLCLSSINIILSSGLNVFLYINYDAAVITQLFVYSIGGSFISTAVS
ncbi:Odorant receptor [Sergentomyia squamirostris]